MAVVGVVARGRGTMAGAGLLRNGRERSATVWRVGGSVMVVAGEALDRRWHDRDDVSVKVAVAVKEIKEQVLCGRGRMQLLESGQDLGTMRRLDDPSHLH